ncbi:MAG: Rab family GTPase [Candidatus Hodarchaeales archaeon]
MNSNEEFIFKILVCGPVSVGKTCLVHRYVDNIFLKDTQSTIGVDFSLKNIKIEKSDKLPPFSKNTILQIWDMAGEESFKELLDYYANGAHGVFFVFDINNPDSLKKLQEWVDSVNSLLPPSTPYGLISAKHDLESQISEEEIKDFCAKNKIDSYTPTSAKTNQNVHEAFVNLVTKIFSSNNDELQS